MRSRPIAIRVVRIFKAAQQERMDAEPVVFQHRGGDLFRRSHQAGGVARCAGGARDPHPQPFVMDIAARGIAEQPLAGMVARFRRFAGLAFDVGQQGVRLVPGRAFGFRHDRAQRHVEVGASAERGRAAAEIVDAGAGLGERFAEDREHVAMFGAHLQRAVRRAAEEQPRIGLLIGLDVGIRALDPIELAMVVERAVAGPDPANDIEIFAGAAVAVVLGQEIAFAGLILHRWCRR